MMMDFMIYIIEIVYLIFVRCYQHWVRGGEKRQNLVAYVKSGNIYSRYRYLSLFAQTHHKTSIVSNEIFYQ